MKSFPAISTIAIAICVLASNALAQSPVRAQLGSPTLLKDPADTNRIVKGTILRFASDGTYRFTIKYSTDPGQPALRLIVYTSSQPQPATDCMTVVCWSENVYSSSVEGHVRRFDKQFKRGSELLVVAWQGGSSKSRGGDPISPVCPPNAQCGVSLSSTASSSKLQLTMVTLDSQSATLEVERLP